MQRSGVRHGNHAARLARAEIAQPTRYALAHQVKRLTTLRSIEARLGRSVLRSVGKARANLVPRQTLPQAEIELAQSLVHTLIEVMWPCYRRRRFARALEVARVDGVDRAIVQRKRKGLRLRAAVVTERDIATPLKAPADVPRGAPVANQNEFPQRLFIRELVEQIEHVVGMLFFHRENRFDHATRGRIVVA